MKRKIILIIGIVVMLATVAGAWLIYIEPPQPGYEDDIFEGGFLDGIVLVLAGILIFYELELMRCALYFIGTPSSCKSKWKNVIYYFTVGFSLGGLLFFFSQRLFGIFTVLLLITQGVYCIMWLVHTVKKHRKTD